MNEEMYLCFNGHFYYNFTQFYVTEFNTIVNKYTRAVKDYSTFENI